MSCLGAGSTILGGAISFPIAFLALALSAAPGLAGDPTTIKVALLDMSSAVGMMGGRMMRDWGQGQGQGGWMGPGMMGMMGPNGMSMMSMRADQNSIKAGPVHFDVTNWSRGMVHEMLVVAVDDIDAPLPYDYGQAKVAEGQVRVLADTEELSPNGSRGLDLTLQPGAYLLICNLPGHYASGMATPLRVTP